MESVRSLEVYEEADGASVAAEERSVFVVKDDINAPTWAYPLPPSRRILAKGKVLKYGLWARNQVSFAPQFGTDGYVVLFLVPLCER